MATILNRLFPTRVPSGTLFLIILVGCNSRDARLAAYVERVHQQQHQQNERLAVQSRALVHQSGQITEAAQELIKHDSAARRELLQVQQQLQQHEHAERSELSRQRAQLDADRKEAAIAVVRDPVIAEALTSAGVILAALLPLLVTVYALRKLPDDQPAESLLAEELWALDPDFNHRGSTSSSLPDASRRRLTTSARDAAGSNPGTGNGPTS